MFTFKKFAVVSMAAALTSLSISCSDDPEEDVDDRDLDWKPLQGALSLSGKSYGDLDANVTYNQTDATGSKAGDIDVVAYYTSGAENKIFNPCGIETIGDDCGDPELYPIPEKYQDALKSATKLSDLAEFLGDLDKVLGAEGAGINGGDGNEVWEIDIANGKSFLVFSTESKYFLVNITSSGTQTVSLKFSGNGFEKK